MADKFLEEKAQEEETEGEEDEELGGNEDSDLLEEDTP